MDSEAVTRRLQSQASKEGTATPSGSLPDVNAETYPYEMVQHLLDQTANFIMFAIPDPEHAEVATLTPDDPSDFFGINGGYGLDIRSFLHRFDSVVQPPGANMDIVVEQAVGESTGTFQSRWLFGIEGLTWAPGRLPPPAIYDPWRSQRFAMVDVEFTFEDVDSFRGYGLGRTFPLVHNGRRKLLAGAVGNLMQGSGKFRGLQGTYVMSGSIVPGLGFRGNITCRVVDPDRVLRTDSDIPCLTPIPDPDPETTFIVLRGEKKDRNVKTTYGPPTGGDQVSLITPSQMRSVQYSFTTRGRGGLHTAMRIRQVVGDMQATVFFNLLAPPGTADAPVPFTTKELYTFVGSDGRTIGTITAGVIEGESFDLKFPGAPGQAGVRFAGFGPVLGGTGVFAGVQGMLTVNSVIGIAPHALSLMHVLHILDPDERLRATRAAHQCIARPAPQNKLGEMDPYSLMLRHAEDYTDKYISWRNGFRHCAEQLSRIIVNTYNSLASTGDFADLSIDPDKLKSIFQQEIKPFDEDTFNRYSGAAKGTFRIYDLNTKKEIDETLLYSYWSPKNLRIDRRTMKKITGSYLDYLEPGSLPQLSEKRVDIILNSYREDVGVTSWVEIYQGGRQQRTSIAYKLPHRHEILWFVKDISKDMKLLENNIFMASHEWKGTVDGRICYFMVGIFLEIDFNKCTASLAGDRFWRALYQEEREASV